MKTRIIVWSLFAVLCLRAYETLTTRPVAMAPKVITRALDASVLLRMKTYKDQNGHRMRGGCSGTYVDPTHILTAAHCFELPIEYVWARGPNESVGYPVHVIRLSAAKDLALLEVPYSHPYVRLAKLPKRGYSIFNIGSPLDFEFVVSEGIVGAINYHAHGFTSHYLITTAMINPGSSGGGAFNTKGELVGVNTMTVGFFGWQGISLAVGIDDVKEFLR